MVININGKVKCAAINDNEIDLFESQFRVENGISYNTYLILDEKVAVLDTVDSRFADEWIENIESILGDKEPDFLVIHHMEPDHSGSLKTFLNKYKNTKVVGNEKTFQMIKNFFFELEHERKKVVVEKDILDLGSEKLHFFFAPMVHWPEVMMSYASESKLLFSADAFGKFGNLNIQDDWLDEARRYYFGIVGKYGLQVNSLLKKICNLDISKICPLHGPILDKNVETYINIYKKWANYESEKEGVVIAYTSIYGNTKKAVDILEQKLKNKKVEVKLFDLARCDIYEVVGYVFKYNKLVLATTTYNNGIFLSMKFFLDLLIERNFQNRVVGIIENGSWAPVVEKTIISTLEKCKNVVYAKNVVKIISSCKEDNLNQLTLLAEEIIKL